ncbi:MAG TPA: alpha/beta hydrolase [Capillimicrobium sp.]|jgi:pimeloyl-ACP methyl ester carboxylesterase
MQQISLSAGTVEYDDSGGDGPVVVLLGGLLMDATLWDGLVERLAPRHRCIVPTLPLGGHRHPMRPDADLSLPGLARLVTELLERLDLDDVTLVGNDTGGAIVQLIAGGGESAARVGRIVLVSCEAFDNLPPGLSGKTVFAVGKLPPALLGLALQPLRLRPMRRLPLTFGWLTKRGDAVVARWLHPVLSQREIRRDAVRALRALAADRRLLVDAAARLPSFDRPALVAWAADDRVMPVAHGRRLADILPRGRLVEIADSYTLVPLDQPAALAEATESFVQQAQANRA